MLNRLSKYWLSPKAFYASSNALLPWALMAFLVCVTYGTVAGLFLAPPDYQQGDGFRIIYIHVPSAFTAMAIYVVMAAAGLATLVLRLKIAAIAMACSAPIGAWFTLLALLTGSIWGKPMWGTFWVWDARLTSVLVLLFLYLGFIALYATLEIPEQRDPACSILALLGTINLPIIHYSVIWWNTLHQGPTLTQWAKPAIAASMLWPLLSMIAAFLLFYFFVLLVRMRNQILLREIKTTWVKEALRCKI